MSELLRLANELIKVQHDVELGDAPSVTDLYEHFENAIGVIKGYQELLRHVLSLCDGGHDSDNQDIAERWDWSIGEIEKALPPQENVNE